MVMETGPARAHDSSTSNAAARRQVVTWKPNQRDEDRDGNGATDDQRWRDRVIQDDGGEQADRGSGQHGGDEPDHRGRREEPLPTPAADPLEVKSLRGRRAVQVAD